MFLRHNIVLCFLENSCSKEQYILAGISSFLLLPALQSPRHTFNIYWLLKMIVTLSLGIIRDFEIGIEIHRFRWIYNLWEIETRIQLLGLPFSMAIWLDSRIRSLTIFSIFLSLTFWFPCTATTMTKCENLGEIYSICTKKLRKVPGASNNNTNKKFRVAAS